jgi:hypothetical protein
MRGLELDAKWHKDYGAGMTRVEHDEWREIHNQIAHAFDRKPWQFSLFRDFSGPAPEQPVGPQGDTDLGGWHSGKEAQRLLRAAGQAKG